MEKLPYGLFAVGNGIYGVCTGCDKLIKVNGFWGGKHICLPVKKEVEQETFIGNPVEGKFTSLGTSADGTMESGYVIFEE